MPTGVYFDSTNLQGHTFKPALPTVARYAYVGALIRDHPQAVNFADFPRDDAKEVFFCTPQDLKTLALLVPQTNLQLAIIKVVTDSAVLHLTTSNAFVDQAEDVQKILDLDFPPCAGHLHLLYYEEAQAYHQEYPYAEQQDWAHIAAYNQLGKAYDAAIQSELTYLDQIQHGLPPTPHPPVPTPTPIPPYLS